MHICFHCLDFNQNSIQSKSFISVFWSEIISVFPYSDTNHLQLFFLKLSTITVGLITTAISVAGVDCRLCYKKLFIDGSPSSQIASKFLVGAKA